MLFRSALLETVANCLLGYSKQTGYPVGYFGNDDFFLCLPDEKAEQTAVLATLQACMNADRQDVTFFVVMGVCPMQANPGADAATLCNYAQIAGVTTDSGYLHRFEPTMLNELKEQQQLLGELAHALDTHEFCFFLQPKCNSITSAIVGMEALVRWNHPTRGCVPPAEFMPLLERTGLVTRLDQYIWESVCQTQQKWQESGSNLVPVSVNVSVQDILNLDVPQIFADLVEKYKLEPKLLLAEITETMVAEDTQMVESAIQVLHRKGFSVMMDDFGSVYSSLNMLKDTNVDAIKLDMKLIDMNQQNRSKGVQIVESVVDMAHRLNLPIIAEGVETPEQVSMLQAADCLYTQGYYFYKPMPVENAEALLARIRDERLLTLQAAVGSFPARAEGDDIWITDQKGRERRLAMLRNQTRGEENLSLADFIAPDGDWIGCFALTAGIGLKELAEKFRAGGDDYSAIMAKLLADRLTEAFAEAVHAFMRREMWGYETGTPPPPEQAGRGQYRGRRMAFGYPASPDHSLKREVFDLLSVEMTTGMKLTENYMIDPGEALCGLMFADADYFSVGTIDTKQLLDYARRRGMEVEEIKKLIPNNI